MMKWNVSKSNWSLIAVLVTVVVAFLSLYLHDSRHDRAGEIGNLGGVKDIDKKLFAEDTELFQKKTPPQMGDWLDSHKEKGQTYGEYLRSNPNKIDSTRKVIYVLPLGEFDDQKVPLKALLEYTQSYYHGIEVKMLDVVAAGKVRAKSRLNRGVKQWNTKDILRWMKGRTPRDAYAMIAVTMTDLYPSEKWNFVFGQASYKSRVGVFSFARYADKNPKVSLLRANKILTHEIGHMFGIKHCIHYQCNLNGANHLQEVDRTPANLCRICLRKLQTGAKVDLVKRYQAMHKFYVKHQLATQANWVEKRLAKVGVTVENSDKVKAK